VLLFLVCRGRSHAETTKEFLLKMSVAARRYAKALLDVLYPAKAEMGLDQLKGFATVLSQQNDARLVFENPTVSHERRKDLLNKVGDALKLDTPIRNFLGILIDRNRLDLLNEIISTYETSFDERQGVVQARITSANELSPTQQSEVAARLQAATGKKVRMQLTVDPSLIGGLIAQVGSTIYDASIRQQLQTFKNSLTQD
jgi:F-type H+-transporting ATPase subunit delta